MVEDFSPVDAPPDPAAAEAAPLTPEQFHHKLASDLSDMVWGLLEKEGRTCSETDRMIHAVHASRFHYEFGGTPLNLAIGEWQCARVHATVGQADSAFYHANRALEFAEDYQLGAFPTALAHEACARALAKADPARSADHLRRARATLEEIADPDDRAMVERDLATVPEAGGAGVVSVTTGSVSASGTVSEQRPTFKA